MRRSSTRSCPVGRVEPSRSGGSDGCRRRGEKGEEQFIFPLVCGSAQVSAFLGLEMNAAAPGHSFMPQPCLRFPCSPKTLISHPD